MSSPSASSPAPPPEQGLRGIALPLSTWHPQVRARVRSGQRLAGLYGTDAQGACQLTALLVDGDRIAVLSTLVEPEPGRTVRYPSLSPDVPAAFWYERALHDLSGVVPVGHPRLDPLLLDRGGTAPAPLPGAPAATGESQHTAGERQGPSSSASSEFHHRLQGHDHLPPRRCASLRHAERICPAGTTDRVSAAWAYPSP